VDHEDELFEWFYYLIMNLFNLSNYLTFFQTSKSLLKLIWKLLDQEYVEFDKEWQVSIDAAEVTNKKSKIHLLYFLHNAFQKTIDEKSQASIVINFNPKSPSIHEVYDQKKVLGISISTQDFIFIIEMFNTLAKLIVEDIDSLTQNNFTNLDQIKETFNQRIDFFHGILKVSIIFYNFIRLVILSNYIPWWLQ